MTIRQVLRGIARLWVAALAFGASGCALISNGEDGAGRSSVFTERDYSGAPLMASLAPEERAAFEAALDDALLSGSTTPVRWTAGDVSGTLRPQAAYVANLLTEPSLRVRAAAGLDLDHTMETDLGDYVLTRRANIRAAPTTDGRVLETLEAGTPVIAMGRALDAPWLLVAYQDRVRGYVSEDLTTPAPGSELILAGGPERRPVACRAFSHDIRSGILQQSWTGVACRTPGGEWLFEDASAASGS